MYTIVYFENRTLYFSKLTNIIPTVDEQIKLKGRKGKILQVKTVNDHVLHVDVYFEPVIKSIPLSKELSKRKR